MDTREGATRDLGGYAAIVPGHPDQSELISRVVSHDRDELMPPPKSKKAAFTGEEVAVLKRWIEEGAEYEGHWAFLPLAQGEPPPALGWGKNGIDAFIGQRLGEAGLKPSPEAEPEVLCRRIYLDLIGLLPSPEQTTAFVAAWQKDADRAVAALADELLRSPHYGERWGRHWLDQARYADSNGYSIDAERAMWPYRDWVIEAVSKDMPFDQFTIEQLAGDLLPAPTKAQLVATGFHRNTLINQEGGTDPEQFRVEAAIDRVNTTGAVWLGLTVGCAQCHSHKFDPISQREFYEMFAFFNQAADRNNTGPTVPVSRGELLGRKPTARDAAMSPTELVTWEKAEMTRLEKIRPQTGGPEWSRPEIVSAETTSNAALVQLEDGSLQADERSSSNDAFRLRVRPSGDRLGAVRMQVRAPADANGGRFAITDVVLRVDGKPVRFVRAVADQADAHFPATGAIDGDPATAWAATAYPAAAIFILDQPVPVKGKSVELELRHELAQNSLTGRFAVEVASEIPSRQPAEDALLAALRQPEAKRTEDQRRRVEDARLTQTRQVLTAQAMIMRQNDRPRPTYVLRGGDFTRPDTEGGELLPGGIQAIAPELAPKAGRTRLDLARWLVAKENPLTPRVTMNRVWMRYFGRGLVETEEDFGSQGSPPTHPELLDWLAGELIRKGWSMKAMHKLIVTSATYRQASKARADAAAKDPRNLLLARQERLRLEAEIIRDVALSSSGLLDRQIGGPSVRPPQPEGVYAFTQMPKVWVADSGPDRFRRAMYTMFYRSAPYPLFGTFDAPDFQTVCTRRARSNTPLQSLTLANDPAFLEIAEGLARRVIAAIPSKGPAEAEAQMRLAWRLALCREMQPKEYEALSRFRQMEKETLLAGDASKADLQSLVSVARAIFNTDNFITRE